MKSRTGTTNGILKPGTVLLETLSPLPGKKPRSFLFEQPVHTLEQGDTESLLAFLERAEEWRNTHWLAGYVSFEAGYAEHGIPEHAPLRYPKAWFGVYEQPQEITAPYEFETEEPPVELWRLTPERTDEQFADAISAVIERIAAGEVNQVNLTGRLFSEQPGSLLANYRALTEAQPTAFNAAIMFHTSAGELVEIASLSPELFYSVTTDGGKPRIAMRPMKGTVHRGVTPEEDAKLSEWLQSDPKNRRENHLITEMIFEELHGITVRGSLEVTEAFTTEQYPSVWQMTSTVEGEPTITSLPELFEALFPCGSIAGPPKDSMLELIQSLETSPRGVYTGAIGFAAPDGSSTFSVAIRTLTKAGPHLEYGIGSGIVAGSSAEDEVREWHLKAALLWRAHAHDAQLIETMRYEPEDGLLRAERHLARLARSAEWLGWRVALEPVRDRLARVTGDEPLRVRIQMTKRGDITLETFPLEDTEGPLYVAFATTRVERANPFLQHKTTSRELFNTAAERAQREGLADILFMNEDGEVTEGAISSVFVERDGKLVTPPLKSGALPGVLRQELLELGRAREEILTRKDLESAPVFIGNSVRGLRAVKLKTESVTL